MNNLFCDICKREIIDGDFYIHFPPNRSICKYCEKEYGFNIKVLMTDKQKQLLRITEKEYLRTINYKIKK